MIDLKGKKDGIRKQTDARSTFARKLAYNGHILTEGIKLTIMKLMDNEHVTTYKND